jgi:hypothetical protein
MDANEKLPAMLFVHADRLASRSGSLLLSNRKSAMHPRKEIGLVEAT